MLEIREFDIRATAVEEREVAGIAVPYNTPTTIGNYREQFAPGAAQPADDAMLFWRHDEPIGKIIGYEQTDEGLMIRAHISETPRGNEAYTLVRDGVISKFSVGFEPVEHRVEEDGTVTRTSAIVREVSLVPMPAYAGAQLTEVRESAPETKEEETVENSVETAAPAQDTELREAVEMLERKLETLVTAPVEVEAEDTRSAGEIVKAIVAGDETAIRAYTGGTTADSVVRNGWVGDLTRIVDEAAVLRGVFSSAALPTEGNFIEYAQLDTNTMLVDVQAAEGDDLDYGSISLETVTAAVKTFGGYTTLSRQEIERSSVNILDHALRAQAIAAGKALNGFMRTEYVAEVAAQITATNTVSIPATGVTYGDWLNAAIDAAAKFDAQGLSLDALVVDKATFKSLLNIEGTDGRPVLLVSGAGTNNIGSLNVKGLSGDLASIPVIMDAGLTDEVAFVNRNALRFYGSSVVRLQNDNIINLSKDFSVYTYAAIAHEIPAGIVPVVAAS